MMIPWFDFDNAELISLPKLKGPVDLNRIKPKIVKTAEAYRIRSKKDFFRVFPRRELNRS
jgi:hypothetical protein